jgi:type II secretory pathway predicted ATPase ExeA
VAGGALSFREDPFRLMPDRRYIFSTDGFRQAFEGMLGGIRSRRGIVLLTGPSGTGKTTLLQALQEEMQRDGAIVFLRFHPDTSADLITSCLAELGSAEIAVEESARVSAIIELIKMGTRVGGPPAVLVIDEAGQFSDAQLIDLYRLAAPGHALAEVLQVVLAALPSFEERLQQNALAPLQQAIGHRSRLQPLQAEELAGYIAHRCSVAGCAESGLFDAAAIKRIYDLTRGTPRLVNRLCSAALFVARGSGGDRISAAVIDRAAEGCDLAEPPAKRGKDEDRSHATDFPRASSWKDLMAAKPAEAAPATPPQRAAPGRPRVPATAPTPDSIALAEAERAWAKAGAAAKIPVPPPTPAPSPHEAAAAPAVLELSEPAVLELSEEVHDQAAPTARRRLPSLRIAASIALLAASAATLGVLYWPSPERREPASAEPAATEAKSFAGLPAAAPAEAPPSLTAAPAVPTGETPPAPATAQAESVHAAPDTAPAAVEPPGAQAPTAMAASVHESTPDHEAASPPQAAAIETVADVASHAVEPPSAPPAASIDASTNDPASAIASVSPAQPAAPDAAPAASEPSAVPTAVNADVAANQAETVPPAYAPAAAVMTETIVRDVEAAPVADDSRNQSHAAAEPQPPPESAAAEAAAPPSLPVMETRTAVPTAPAPEPRTEGSPLSPQAPQIETAATVGPAPHPPADAAAAVEPAAGQDPDVSHSAMASVSAEPEREESASAASGPQDAQNAEPAEGAASAQGAPALAMATAVPAEPPPVVTAQAPSVPPANGATAAELTQLMTRGDEMLRIGDPASARLFYERAAMRGLPRAFTAVGRTYDPAVLQRLNIRGGGASGERALEWYRRGAEAGDAEAGRIANDLSAWLARPR